MLDHDLRHAVDLLRQTLPLLVDEVRFAVARPLMAVLVQPVRLVTKEVGEVLPQLLVTPENSKQTRSQSCDYPPACL